MPPSCPRHNHANTKDLLGLYFSVLLDRLNVRAFLEGGNGVFIKAYTVKKLVLQGYKSTVCCVADSREALEDGVFVSNLSSLVGGMLLCSRNLSEALGTCHGLYTYSFT